MLRDWIRVQSDLLPEPQPEPHRAEVVKEN